MADLKYIERFVRLAFDTDCCLDFVTEEISVLDARDVLRAVRWHSFRLDPVLNLLSLMPPDTTVRISRSHGPLLEFHRSGMRHGGIKGMFEEAVAKAGGAEVLGFSRMLADWRCYMLLWNDE